MANLISPAPSSVPHTQNIQYLSNSNLIHLTIIRRKRGDYRGEYSPIITEPETNNCFSIFTQVHLNNGQRKSVLYPKQSHNARGGIVGQLHFRTGAAVWEKISGKVQKISGEVQNDLREGAHLPTKSGHN